MHFNRGPAKPRQVRGQVGRPFGSLIRTEECFRHVMRTNPLWGRTMQRDLALNSMFQENSMIRFLMRLGMIGLGGAGAPMAFAQSALPVAPTAQVLDDKGVDLLTGQLALKDPAVSIGSPDAGGLSVTRSWVGKNADLLGGWRHNFLMYEQKSGNQIPGLGPTMTYGEKSTIFYNSPRPDGTWGAPYLPARQDGVSLPDDEQTFSDRDGAVYTFASFTLYSGSSFGSTIVNPVIRIVKPSGEQILFTYTTFINSWGVSDHRLQSVQTNFGYQIKFEYPGNRWDVSKISAINDAVEYCNPLAASCSGLTNSWPSISYSRPDPSLLGTYTEVVTDETGNTRSFSVNIASKNMQLLVKTPGPSGVSPINYVYDLYANPGDTNATSVVKSITDTSGSWTYTMNAPSGYLAGLFQITKTSPSSVNQIYSNTTDANNVPYVQSYQDGLGRITQYQYGQTLYYGSYINSNILSYLIPPEGTITNGTPTAGYTHNEYDTRGNVIRVTKVAQAGSPLASLVYQAGYDATCTSPAKCNKPNWVQDAKGNQTDYTYDTAHGGILSEMKPAPTAGAPRPLTLTTWAQRYGWVKNSSGAMVQQTSPIWRIATVTQCQTVAGGNAPTCDTAAGAPNTVTTFEYGASGTRFALLVKGVAVTSGGVTLRTCYDYDIYGNRTSTTTPNANLGACP